MSLLAIIQFFVEIRKKMAEIVRIVIWVQAWKERDIIASKARGRLQETFGSSMKPYCSTSGSQSQPGGKKRVVDPHTLTTLSA
jgi:hypothetical protein